MLLNKLKLGTLNGPILCALLGTLTLTLTTPAEAKLSDLPAPRIVEEVNGTADNVIQDHVTSLDYHRFPQVSPFLRAIGYPWFQSKVVKGQDLTGTSAEIISNFVKESGNFRGLGVRNSDKFVIFLTMNLGDPSITTALLEAQKAGLSRVHVIVDGLSGLDLRSSSRRRRAGPVQLKDVKTQSNDMGRELDRLFEAGFQLNDLEAPYSIYTDDLSAEGIRSLMHMKGFYLGVTGPQGERWLSFLDLLNWRAWRTYIMGRSERETAQNKSNAIVYARILTANATDYNVDERQNFVFNRALKVADDHLAEDLVRHADALRTAYSVHGELKPIESLPPLRKVFPDGTFIQQSFTDGKYNWNENIVDVFERAMAGEFEITELVIGAYVLAKDDLVETLRRYMQRNPNTRVKATFDRSFVDGSGLAKVLAGFNSGDGKKMICGFSPDLCSRIEATSYTREQDEQAQARNTDKGRLLFHDKSVVIQIKRNGKTFYYAGTGSLNISDHGEENAEVQLFGLFNEQSRFPQEIIKSILGRRLLAPEHFMPLESGALRGSLARFIGVPAPRITQEQVNRIEQLLASNSYWRLSLLLKKLWTDCPSGERKVESEAEIRSRLGALKSFFKIHKSEVWAQKYYQGKAPGYWWLWSDAKDALLDLVLAGRTHLNLQQLSPVLDTLSDRKDGKVPKQMQRMAMAISPDGYITDEECYRIAMAMLEQMQVSVDPQKYSLKTFVRNAVGPMRKAQVSFEDCQRDLANPNEATEN